MYFSYSLQPLTDFVSEQSGGPLPLPARLEKDSECETEKFRVYFLTGRRETGFHLFTQPCQQSSGPFQMVQVSASSHLPAHLNQSIMSTKYLIQVRREQKCAPSGSALRIGRGNPDLPEDTAAGTVYRVSEQSGKLGVFRSFICCRKPRSVNRSPSCVFNAASGSHVNTASFI